MVNKYKSADAPERHRLIKKVRLAQLRSSSDDLGGDGERDSLDSTIPYNFDNAIADGSDSDLDLDLHLDDAEVHERRLEEKRKLWESSLPKTNTELDLKPITKSGYTFIESDETPTKTYEQRYFERKQNRSSLRQKLPFR